MKNLYILTLDENLQNKDALNPIQEEDQETSESHITDNREEDACEEDDEENTKYQFPDTQIKIDLSGPK